MAFTADGWVEWDTITYSVTFTVCEERQRHSAAGSLCEKGGVWLLRQWRQQLQQQLQRTACASRASGATCAANSACEKGNERPLVVDLLCTMAVDHVEHNIISYNATFAACDKALVGSQAVVLSAMLAAVCVVRFAVSFHAAVRACRLGGKYVGLLSPPSLRRPGAICFLISCCGFGHRFITSFSAAVGTCAGHLRVLVAVCCGSGLWSWGLVPWPFGTRGGTPSLSMQPSFPALRWALGAGFVQVLAALAFLVAWGAWERGLRP